MLLDPVRATFRAIAATVVPEASALDDGGWGALEALVEKTLEPRPASVKRQLVLFIRTIEHLPRLRWGRGFSALTPDERTRFLSGLERAPSLLLRRGFWGLRTLVFLGYYARPEAAAAIGYRAEARGWEARRA
ncbi:MAG TPA: hypothetical protein VMV60_00360 [Thermoanaerobaculia bacterium]|nr:hypothetical protein [Thermoanaerobaculia bacterium]